MTTLSAEHVQATFRETMAAVCTPVTVITAIRSGQPFGTTVSAFASLSMNPPMVLVSLDRTSDLLGVIRDVGEFGVNVLSSHQAPTAVRFATKGGSAKFDGVRWHAETGVPRLPGGCCFLLCTVTRLIDGGDHIIVLGEVAAADSTADAPLTYHGRTFGTHTVLPRHGIRSCHLAEDAHPATIAHRVPRDWLAPWVHGPWLEY